MARSLCPKGAAMNLFGSPRRLGIRRCRVQIVPGQWHRMLAARQLEMEHGLRLILKGHLASDKVKAPHPDEPLVIHLANFGQGGLEPFRPVVKGRPILTTPDLDIGGPEPRLFDGRGQVGQGRNIAAGKDILLDPRICRGWGATRPMVWIRAIPSSAKRSWVFEK